MNASLILELSLCLIENFAIYFFLDRLFKRRFSFVLLPWIVALVNSVIIFLLPDMSYLKILISIVAVTGGCMLLYRTKVYIASVFAMTFIYILYIIDIISGSLLSVITSADIISIMYDSLIQRIIICLIVKIIDIAAFWFVYKQFIKPGFNNEIKQWLLYNIIIFVFLLISSMFMMLYSDNGDFGNELVYLLLAVFFFAMSLIVMYFYTYILESNNRNWQYNLLKANYDSIEENLLVQQEQSEKLQKIRHDIRNHLLLAHTLIKKNQADMADDIITHTIDQTDSINIDITRSSGNSIIDAIIASKAAACRKRSIKLEYIFDPLPELTIDILDISSVLSNLLDNAITAATNTPSPYIETKIAILGDYLSIIVKNNYSFWPVQISDDGIMFINLHDTERSHGYGTKIIREIANKYSGSYEWIKEDTYYTASVLLSISA